MTQSQHESDIFHLILSDFQSELNDNNSNKRLKYNDNENNTNNFECVSRKLISQLIATKSSRIESETVNGKSDVWKIFNRIKIDGELTDFVICKNCNLFYKNKGLYN